MFGGVLRVIHHRRILAVVLTRHADCNCSAIPAHASILRFAKEKTKELVDVD